MTVDQITGGDWQMGLSGLGMIAQGVDDINQCLQIILLTVPGSDPLRPEFGAGIFNLIDLPANLAIFKINAEVISSISKWEKRVKINRVRTYYQEDKIEVEIYWSTEFKVDGFLSVSFASAVSPASNSPFVSAPVINPVTQPLIRRLDWQLGFEFGGVAQGLNDLTQCILIIATTRKGSDPFRPDFGCGLWDFVDLPLQTAAPLMAASIKQAVSKYEKRITLLKVSYYFEKLNGDSVYSGIVFSLSFRLVGGFTTNQAEIIFGLAEDGLLSGANPVIPDLRIKVLGAEDGAAISTENEKLIEI
jgi:phage baseplate assembly protein W